MTRLIDNEAISKMTDAELFETIDFFQEQVNIIEDFDKKDKFDQMLTYAIGELKERYVALKKIIQELSK